MRRDRYSTFTLSFSAPTLPSVIHSSAVISPEAHLAEDVEVGPFCVVGANVTLGKGCHLHSHVAIEGYSEIGEDNEFYPHTAIGTRSQDLKYAGEPTRVKIGSRNVFRENVTVHRGTMLEPSVIGNDNHFLAYAHVAHDSIVGNHCILSNGATLGGHVIIGDHVIVSGLSGIHQFCRIGDHAIIGGCTKIVQDVPPFLIADGNPAALRGINLVGLQRRGFSPEGIRSLKQAYKKLFLNKTANLAQQQVAFQESLVAPTEEVTQLLEFLAKTDRGFVR
jgi:UDP-N-acetylglucosamine acyltransferase